MTATDETPSVDEMALRLLHQGRDDVRELVVLTDADLLALDGLHGEHVAPMPWLGGRDDPTKELAAELGWRQLAARGLAATSYDAGTALHVSLQVQAVLQLRRASSAIVIAQQETGFGANCLVIYGQGRLGILAEAVDGYGLHRFSTMSAQAAFDALLSFAVPTGTYADADGPVTVHAEAEWTTSPPAELGEAVAATVLAGVSRSGTDVIERRLSLYALPDRVVAGLPVSDGLGIRDVTRDTVTELLRGLSGSSPQPPESSQPGSASPSDS